MTAYPDMIAARNNADELAELLAAAEVVAADNMDTWWGPLVEQPLEGINPAALAVHAAEGAARAQASYRLLAQCLPLASRLQQQLHKASLQG